MRKHTFLAFSITVAILSVWWRLYSFHYGWMDDVQDLNVMKGEFVNGCRLFEPDQFLIIQNLFQWLYHSYPQFPWYGSFLYLLLAYSTYLTIALIGARFIQSLKTSLTVSILFTFAFLLEFANAVNFTEIAIFTSGVCLIKIYFLSAEFKLGWFKIIMHLSIWLLALLIRWDVVLFTTSVITIMFLFYTRADSIRNFSSVALTILGCIVLFVSYQRGYLHQKEEHKQIALLNSYLFTMSDASQTNLDNLKTDEDKILHEAVLSWNVFDKYKITETMYRRIGFKTPLRTEVLLHIRERFNLLMDGSMRYSEYLELYNWAPKFLLVFLLNIGLLLLQYRCSGLGWKRIVLSHSVFWIMLLLVGIFVKMENRLFFPVSGLFTLFNILSIQKPNVRGRTENGLITMCTLTGLTFAVFMIFNNSKAATDLNVDLNNKRSFWREIGTLKNKIIVYDMHSLLTLHDSPFKEVCLPKHNENIIVNHHYMTHFRCLNDYYITREGSDSINRILKFLYERRKDVYWVGTEYNMDFLSRYMQVIYKLKYQFKEDSSFAASQFMNRNFLHKPLRIRVYRFSNGNVSELP